MSADPFSASPIVQLQVVGCIRLNCVPLFAVVVGCLPPVSLTTLSCTFNAAASIGSVVLPSLHARDDVIKAHAQQFPFIVGLPQ